MIDDLNLIARQKLSQPPEWQWIRWEILEGTTMPSPEDTYKVTGAVMPIKKRGRLRGLPSWRQRDRNTERVAYITRAERAAFAADFEKKTGICFRCAGTGERITGWNSITGHRFEPCTRCGTTGQVTTRVGVPA